MACFNVLRAPIHLVMSTALIIVVPIPVFYLFVGMLCLLVLIVALITGKTCVFFINWKSTLSFQFWFYLFECCVLGVFLLL